ncbi:MAG: PEPxxWA-CTERM sorting domain-containing protein [Azoarcus sp.]|jgi:hypothetical protein|nr:PEPxxWA-CTERM sorting domain-containing protein [Azoarcus sp.]
MSKLFSASLLALGIAFSVPSAAQSSFLLETVHDAHIYITDPTKPIDIAFGVWILGNANTKDSTRLYMATLDVNGNIVDDWSQIGGSFTDGAHPNDPNWRPERPQYNSHLSAGDNEFRVLYTPGEGAYEIVFKLWNQTIDKYVYYYGSGNNQYVHFDNVYEGSDFAYTYYAQAIFNDGTNSWAAAGTGSNHLTLMLRNVSMFPPSSSPVPEPETYAMLLAGLGMIGAVARRRSRR